MNTKDITVKLPISAEYDYFFNDEICIESVFDFQKEFNEKVSMLNQSINDANNVLRNNGIINVGLNMSPINLYFCSPGGECYTGLAMHDYLKDISKNTDINIIAQGHVMSMGVPVMLALPLENRFAYKNTTFMIHSVSGLVIGCIGAIEDSLTEQKRLNEMLYDIIVENTKITKEQLEHYKERKKDWIIDANTALELGIISKIL